MPSSAGTKVTAGKNAPVTQEGPGAVPADSLAAESQAFQSRNENAGAQSKPQEGSTGSGTANANAGTAPTYVENLYHKEGGPKGKNLKEDPNMEGTNTSFTEFGTQNDPARAAEDKILRQTITPAAAATAPESSRQQGKDNQTPFDALGAEKEA
jgi:hypothetical protein